MPSVLSHPAVSLGLLAAVGTKTIPARLGVVACVASVIPDVDVIGFKAGVPYGSFFGHRGFTHSLFFALLIAGVAAAFAGRLGASPWVLLGIVFVSAASHGILDAMTTGGMGVAFLSPFSNHRYFFPWRVIEVAPLGIGRFFSARGLTVLRSEFIWVWIPCALVGMTGFLFRRASISFRQ